MANNSNTTTTEAATSNSSETGAQEAIEKLISSIPALRTPRRAVQRPGFVLDGVFAEWKAECEAVQEFAASLRAMSMPNPFADGLDEATKRLSARLVKVVQDHDYLTAEQYADLCDVTPQSVRTWIQKGELKARDTANGYLIPRNAKREKKGKTV